MCVCVCMHDRELHSDWGALVLRPFNLLVGWNRFVLFVASDPAVTPLQTILLKHSHMFSCCWLGVPSHAAPEKHSETVLRRELDSQKENKVHLQLSGRPDTSGNTHMQMSKGPKTT